MTDKVKSAELILKLYELRREPVMREARNWFFAFNPESFEDVQRATMGEHSAYLRMVSTYWDMACSFVNHGAIDAEMFGEANGEHIFVFAKLQPFLEQIRATNGNPNAFRNLEQAVTSLPGAEERVDRARAMSKAVAQARADAAAGQAEADAANA